LYTLGTVATIFEQFFPDDWHKQTLAKFIRALDHGFDLLTSRVIFSKNPYKSALEVNLPQQLASLNDLYEQLDTIHFNPGNKTSPGAQAQLPCQKACKMAITAAIKLQEILATQHDTPWLMTSNICQCYLESWFGVIRGKGGCNVHPTGLDFLGRVGRWLKEKILKDDHFDIEALKNDLPGRFDRLFDPPEVIDDAELPIDEVDSYEDSGTALAHSEGIFWIAGKLLSKMLNALQNKLIGSTYQSFIILQSPNWSIKQVTRFLRESSIGDLLDQMG
jgi:hypothetical protein